VRLLLDSFFDEDDALRSNRATAGCLAGVAAAEHIDIATVVGNLTGGGIHANWVLLRVGRVKWSAVGTLNGGEISYKVNREVVLMVDQPAIYDRLLSVFLHDCYILLHTRTA